MNITLYTFENTDGTSDAFTTFDPIEAKERGERYSMIVRANEYEYADNDVAWDFTRPEAALDPDACLAEIREITARLLNSDLDAYGPGLVTDADRLAELNDALDNWIKGGGCLPAAWQGER